MRATPTTRSAGLATLGATISLLAVLLARATSVTVDAADRVVEGQPVEGVGAFVGVISTPWTWVYADAVIAVAAVVGVVVAVIAVRVRASRRIIAAVSLVVVGLLSMFGWIGGVWWAWLVGDGDIGVGIEPIPLFLGLPGSGLVVVAGVLLLVEALRDPSRVTAP